MFDYEIALAICLGVPLIPIIIFYIARPFIRNQVIKKMVNDKKVSFPPLIAGFILLEILSLGLTGLGLFSIFFPHYLDLGLEKKILITIDSKPSGFLQINEINHGKTPVAIRLRKGKYKVKINGGLDYLPAETLIVVRNGDPFRYEMKLKRAAKRKIRTHRNQSYLRKEPGWNSPVIRNVGKTELGFLSTKDGWLEVRLIDGTEGWIHQQDTVPLIEIIITSTPSDAYVYVNKSCKGRTPLQVSLNPGTYDINVGGIEGYKSIKKNITVSTTGSKEFHFPLEREPPPPSPVEIEINSIPSGADVYINETYYGKTLLRVNLKPGNYRLDLNLSGYQPIKGHVIPVRQEGNRCFTFELQPIVKVKPPDRG